MFVSLYVCFLTVQCFLNVTFLPFTSPRSSEAAAGKWSRTHLFVKVWENTESAVRCSACCIKRLAHLLHSLLLCFCLGGTEKELSFFFFFYHDIPRHLLSFPSLRLSPCLLLLLSLTLSKIPYSQGRTGVVAKYWLPRICGF